MNTLDRLVFYYDGFIWIVQDGILFSKEEGNYYRVIESTTDD